MAGTPSSGSREAGEQEEEAPSGARGGPPRHTSSPTEAPSLPARARPAPLQAVMATWRQPGSARGHGRGLPLPCSRPGSLGTQLLMGPKGDISELSELAQGKKTWAVGTVHFHKAEPGPPSRQKATLPESPKVSCAPTNSLIHVFLGPEDYLTVIARLEEL